MTIELNQAVDSAHNYRTEIPNIVLELDLDVYAFRLYTQYKKISGDRGQCWQTVKTLARGCSMSERQVRISNKTLCEPRPLLQNKSLITITKRHGENGSPASNVVTIVDIWPINMTRIAEMKRQDVPGTRHTVPGGTAQYAGGVLHNMQEGTAPRAVEEDHIEEDPIEEEEGGGATPTPPTAKPPSIKKLGYCVKLTKTEWDSLVDEFGESRVVQYIELINSYAESKGKKNPYKSYSAAIRNWIKRDGTHGNAAKSDADDKQQDRPNPSKALQLTARNEGKFRHGKKISTGGSSEWGDVEVVAGSQYAEIIQCGAQAPSWTLPYDSWEFAGKFKNALAAKGVLMVT